MLTAVHNIGFFAIVIAAIGYACIAVVAGRNGGAPTWVHAAFVAFLTVVVGQGLLGIAIALLHSGPAEGIHWVYGGAMLVVVLVGNGVGVTLPARRRGAVMATTAALVLVLAYRLSQTG